MFSSNLATMRNRESWRRLMLGAFVFSFLVLSLVVTGSGQEDPASTARPESLFSLLEDSKTFFRLQRGGQRVLPVVDGGVREYEELAKKLRQIGGAASSSTSNSTRYWMKSFSGANLTGQFGAGDLSSNIGLFGFSSLPEDGFAVQVIESTEPFAKLNAKADAKTGEIDIRFSREADNFLFRFFQAKTGELLVQEISGAGVFCETESNFVIFQQKHGERLNGAIADMLRYLRIEPPTSKFSEHVVEHVLDRLRPIDAQVKNEFQKIVDDLTGGKFAEREKKTKQLLEEYSKWKKYIHAAADNDDVPAETRLRLRKIISKTASETQKQEFELLLNSKLEEDPKYLVWLLENNVAPLADTDRQIVYAALRKVSKQNIGDEPGLWQAWLENEFPAQPQRDYSKFASEVSLNLNGPLNELAAPVKTLLQLKMTNTGLEIDVAKWAELYDNKSMKQLVDEVRQHLQKKHLPANWLKVDPFYSLAATGYPQILFESIRLAADQLVAKDASQQSAFRRVRSGGRVAMNSRNRMFTSKIVGGRLLMHPVMPLQQRKLILQGDRPVNPVVLNRKDEDEPADEEFLRLQLTEAELPNRRLIFSTDEGFGGDRQGFLIRLEVDSVNGFLSLMGKKSDGGEYVCRLVDVRGNDVFIAEAESLRELQSKNARYFDTELKPILDRLGVSW